MPRRESASEFETKFEGTPNGIGASSVLRWNALTPGESGDLCPMDYVLGPSRYLANLSANRCSSHEDRLIQAVPIIALSAGLDSHRV
jgi:hypothetical protein